MSYERLVLPNKTRMYLVFTVPLTRRGQDGRRASMQRMVSPQIVLTRKGMHRTFSALGARSTLQRTKKKSLTTDKIAQKKNDKKCTRVSVKSVAHHCGSRQKIALPSRTRRSKAAGGVIEGSAHYGQKKKYLKKMHLYNPPTTIEIHHRPKYRHAR